MLLSCDCIKIFKLAGHLLFNIGWNESSLAPQFEWLDNTLIHFHASLRTQYHASLRIQFHASLRMQFHASLKVPKCEIFDRSDFHDFYPIKSLWEGDFGVKIKCFKKYI